MTTSDLLSQLRGSEPNDNGGGTQTSPAGSPSVDNSQSSLLQTLRTSPTVQDQQQQEENQPGFWERTYESSGLKGLVDTGKAKWQQTQAIQQRQEQFAKLAEQHVKDHNWGQLAEDTVKFLGQEAYNSGPVSLHDVVNAGEGQYENAKTNLGEAGEHYKQAGNEAMAGNIWNTVKQLVAAGYSEDKAIPLIGQLIGGTVDPAIEDIKSGNIKGVAGDVVGGAVKAAPLVLTGGAAAGAEGAEAAEAGEAGLASRALQGAKELPKNIIKGEKVAQPGARAAVESAAKASAGDAGVDAGEVSGPMRQLLDKPIAAATKAEDASYETLNKAAKTDVKSLYDYKSELEDALDDPTNIASKKSLTKELEQTNSQIATAEKNISDSGIDKDALSNAKAQTQQRFAMEDLKKRLFNNESIVEGNAAHGVDETINVRAAIREVEKLDKPSRYAPEGTPTRLEQALGKDGAKSLKDELYSAQKRGELALTQKKIATWLGGVAIGGLGLHSLTH